jgi:hypothetical protein
MASTLALLRAFTRDYPECEQKALLIVGFVMLYNVINLYGGELHNG